MTILDLRRSWPKPPLEIPTETETILVTVMSISLFKFEIIIFIIINIILYFLYNLIHFIKVNISTFSNELYYLINSHFNKQNILHLNCIYKYYINLIFFVCLIVKFMRLMLNCSKSYVKNKHSYTLFLIMYKNENTSVKLIMSCKFLKINCPPIMEKMLFSVIEN